MKVIVERYFVPYQPGQLEPAPNQGVKTCHRTTHVPDLLLSRACPETAYGPLTAQASLSQSDQVTEMANFRYRSMVNWYAFPQEPPKRRAAPPAVLGTCYAFLKQPKQNKKETHRPRVNPQPESPPGVLVAANAQNNLAQFRPGQWS